MHRYFLIILSFICVFYSISYAAISKYDEKELSTGTVQIQIPNEMNISESYQIIILIHENSSNILEKDSENVLSKFFEIQMSPIMEVELNGSDFEIDPESKQRQLILLNRSTIWEWIVSPQKTGKQKMTISIFSIISFHHSDPIEIREQVFRQEFEIEVKSKEIAVQVSERRQKIPEEHALNWVGWDPPTTMENGTNYYVNVSIGPDKVSLLDRFVKPRVNFSEINVTAGLSYKVTISGMNFETSLDKGFQEVQRYNPDRPPLWIWRVKPTEKGLQTLKLLIWLTVNKDDEIYELEKIKETEIVITVRDKNLSDWANYIYNLLFKNMQIIISLLALILGSGFGWEWWKSRGKKSSRSKKG